MEDIVINGYTQFLLGGIGTALTATIGALFLWVKQLISENNTLRDKHDEKMTAVIDRYHNFATTMERLIKG